VLCAVPFCHEAVRHGGRTDNMHWPINICLTCDSIQEGLGVLIAQAKPMTKELSG